MKKKQWKKKIIIITLFHKWYSFFFLGGGGGGGVEGVGSYTLFLSGEVGKKWLTLHMLCMNFLFGTNLQRIFWPFLAVKALQNFIQPSTSKI